MTRAAALAMLTLAACRGGDTLDQPNPPPVWPLENVRTDAPPHMPTTREQAADAAAAEAVQAEAAEAAAEAAAAPPGEAAPPAEAVAPGTPPAAPTEPPDAPPEGDPR